MTLCVTSTHWLHRHTPTDATFFHSQTPSPLPHLSPPHAVALKKGSLSTNEAWDHFTDGWLIPQMHQPDQSPIYCLLISAPRAALLSSGKKKQIYYKDLGHDNCWYPVCACVFPYGCGGGTSPAESLYFTLCAFISTHCVNMCKFARFRQLACNYLLMFNKFRRCKDQI